MECNNITMVNKESILYNYLLYHYPRGIGGIAARGDVVGLLAYLYILPTGLGAYSVPFGRHTGAVFAPFLSGVDLGAFCGLSRGFTAVPPSQLL